MAASTWICASLLKLGESCRWVGVFIAVITFVLVDVAVAKLAVLIICVKAFTDFRIATWWLSLPEKGYCMNWCSLANTTSLSSNNFCSVAAILSSLARRGSDKGFLFQF